MVYITLYDVYIPETYILYMFYGKRAYTLLFLPLNHDIYWLHKSINHMVTRE
jgi:hypothetical protein